MCPAPIDSAAGFMLGDSALCQSVFVSSAAHIHCRLVWQYCPLTYTEILWCVLQLIITEVQ